MWQSVMTIAPFGERSRIVLLSTTWARMKGLLGRGRLHRNVGVLLIPCSSVHTVGMRFALDIVFLDRAFNVIKIAADVPPGRLLFCPRAYSVLERASRPDQSIASAHAYAAAIARDACDRVFSGNTSGHSMAEDASSTFSLSVRRGRLSMSNTET